MPSGKSHRYTARLLSALGLTVVASLSLCSVSAVVPPVVSGFRYPVGDNPSSPGTSGWTSVKTGKSYTGWAVIKDGDFLSPNYDSLGSLHPAEDWNGLGDKGDDDFQQPVYAIYSGIVVFAGDGGCGWGNIVLIEHRAPPGASFVLPSGGSAQTVWSQYAHLDSIATGVVVGKSVGTRMEIGTIGRGYKCNVHKQTGKVISTFPAYSPHLHIEIRIPTSPSDPPLWPQPPDYWPSTAGKDANWVRARYVDPSSFIELNREINAQPTAGFTMRVDGTATDTCLSPNCETNGQTLNITVSAGGVARVTISSPDCSPGPSAGCSYDPDGAIAGREWRLDGVSAFPDPLPLTYSVAPGTDVWSLTVVDDKGARSATVTGTINVIEVEPPPPPSLSLVTSRVSVASDGSQANGQSQNAAISADGRYVAFESTANNLVPNDTNGLSDVFVHDRVSGATTRVSVATDGSEARVDGSGWCCGSFAPSISWDGRYVAFVSEATNLVVPDTNENFDIFVHDRITGDTTRVNIANDGVQADAYSDYPSISFDGRYVAFYSEGSNLPNPTPFPVGVYVHDRMTTMTHLVSVASDGSPGNGRSDRPPQISADGSHVAFFSNSTNLGNLSGSWSVYVHNRHTGTTILASVADGTPLGVFTEGLLTINADGKYVVFSGGNPGELIGQIYLRDLAAPGSELVSVAADGASGDASSWWPSISWDGRYVVFHSQASNLEGAGSDFRVNVFRRDRLTAQTIRVAKGLNCDPGKEFSLSLYCHNQQLVTADGRIVVYASKESDLILNDTNGVPDAFATVLVTNPHLSIDGKGISIRPQGATFSFAGSGFTPNGSVRQYLRHPDWSEVVLPAVSADSAGNASWSFATTCSTPVGSYSVWAVDETTGRVSNTVIEIVTSGCGG